jgi:NitT/TauT family transport system substrate-binding protein
MKKQTQVVSTCLILVLIATLAACQVNQPASSLPSTPALQHIKLSTLPYTSFSPIFIADDAGFFKEQGIAIDYVKLSEDGSQSIPALAKGDLDVLGGSVSSGLFNAISKQNQIKIVADKGYISKDACSYETALVRKDLLDSGAIKTPADLRGKRIAALTTNITGYYLTHLLDLGGLTMKDVQILNIPNASRLQGLKDKTIDVVITVDPWSTQIIDAGAGEIWMPAEKIFPDFQLGVLAFGPSITTRKDDLGQKFMTAYLKGVKQYLQGKTDQNLAIIAKHTGQEISVLKDACLPAFHSDGKIDIPSVMLFQDWAVQSGALDEAVKPEQFWDSQYIEKITP